MEAGSSRKTEVSRRVTDGLRAADCPGGYVESRDDAVTTEIPPPTPKMVDLPTRQLPEPVLHIGPAPVTERDGALRRADKLDGQDGDQEIAGHRVRAGAGYERFDLVDEGIHVSEELEVVATG